MSQESPVLAYLLYEFQMNGEFEFLIDGPANGEHELLLAHGAGAAMDSPFAIQARGGPELNSTMNTGWGCWF